MLMPGCCQAGLETKLGAIAGAVHVDGRDMTEALLASILRAAVPRGFDGVKHWHDGPAGLIRFAHATTPEAVSEVQPFISTRSGAVMVFDRGRDMLRVIENFTRFFAHESCGFCTPCRVGTTLNARAMGRIASGNGSQRDLSELVRVSALLESASHCGLGTTAARPINDALAKFRPSFERRLRSREVLPTFDLDEALAPAREVTARDDPGAHLRQEET